MSPQPFMPLFFGDLLAATPTWDGEERALYLLLLAYQWSAGPLPADPKKIAKMCQYDQKTFPKLWATVGKKFIETGAGLINERLEGHRQKANEISNKRANAGAKGAAKRWQDDKQTDDKPIAIATDLPCHPNHTIPSQNEDSLRGETPSVDQAIFSDARKIFGKSIGGQINRAIKSHGKPWVVGIIDACRSKDPEQARAYLASALNGARKPDEAQSRRVMP